ncbi:MAG: bile acid:sodium symporter family protein [Pirellulales bacterium]
MFRDRSESDFWKHLLPQYACVYGPLALGLMLIILGYYFNSSAYCRYGGIAMVAGFAVGLFTPKLRGYRFTFWILIANITALLSPDSFKSIGQFPLNNSWLMMVVVQLIMFGMGTQMSFRDFAKVGKMPYAVLVGLCCQFIIMPLLGFSLAKLFQFPDEIAAGVILIGSCSSGLASNVMTYLARGNLALSVAITAIATLLAPIFTPLWMKYLASSFIKVNALAMSLDIVKMVIVPILAAFTHDWLSQESGAIRKSVKLAILISSIWLCFLVVGGWNRISSTVSNEDLLQLLGLLGFFAAAIVFGYVYHQLTLVFKTIDQAMPKVSMTGIVFFTLITTAYGSEHLKEVGLLLLLASFLHNVLGYFFGYCGGRLLGLNRSDAKTVAIEVGTQNGSMGVGIATNMNKLDTVGLASIVFAPLMNVTGSILANYWRRQSSVDAEIESDPKPY